MLVVIVLLAGTGTGMLWRYQQHFALAENARTAAVEAARTAAVETLSYDFRSVDRDVEQARQHLTGKFLEEYSDLAQKTMIPAVKQQKVNTRVDVVAASVVTAEPDRTVVLLFINQYTQSVGSDAQKTNGSRVRMTMERAGDRWLVSELAPV
ncbi:MAG: h domain protein [Rhodospirillales bacterium]|nr:h domain protein [Rhodospirillales bacterium]